MLPAALGVLDRGGARLRSDRAARLKEKPAKLEKRGGPLRSLSGERIRQIEKRAFEKLRKAMRSQMSPPNEETGRNTGGRRYKVSDTRSSSTSPA